MGRPLRVLDLGRVLGGPSALGQLLQVLVGEVAQGPAVGVVDDPLGGLDPVFQPPCQHGGRVLRTTKAALMHCPVQ